MTLRDQLRIAAEGRFMVPSINLTLCNKSYYTQVLLKEPGDEFYRFQSQYFIIEDDAVSQAIAWLNNPKAFGRVPIAQCVVNAGYSTGYRDERGQWIDAAYASIVSIGIGHPYWERYAKSMSAALAKDFGLYSCFSRFKLTIWSDGDCESERIDD